MKQEWKFEVLFSALLLECGELLIVKSNMVRPILSPNKIEP